MIIKSIEADAKGIYKNWKKFIFVMEIIPLAFLNEDRIIALFREPEWESKRPIEVFCSHLSGCLCLIDSRGISESEAGRGGAGGAGVIEPQVPAVRPAAVLDANEAALDRLPFSERMRAIRRHPPWKHYNLCCRRTVQETSLSSPEKIYHPLYFVGGKGVSITTGEESGNVKC